MPRLMTMTFEVSDQEFATYMERVASRAASTAIPAGAVAPAIAQVAESDEAEDDDAPSAVAPAGAEVDGNGVPHNPAVHASTKGKTAEGYWKRLKGVSKEAYDAYAAPFIAAKNAAPAGGVPPLPGSVPAPGAGTGLPGFPPIGQPADVPVSYEDLLAKFGALQQAGKSVAQEVVMPIYAKVGITDLNQLQTNETLRRALMAELNKL